MLGLHHSTACKGEELTATIQPGLHHTAMKWLFLASESLLFGLLLIFINNLRGDKSLIIAMKSMNAADITTQHDNLYKLSCCVVMSAAFILFIAIINFYFFIFSRTHITPHTPHTHTHTHTEHIKYGISPVLARAQCGYCRHAHHRACE